MTPSLIAAQEAERALRRAYLNRHGIAKARERFIKATAELLKEECDLACEERERRQDMGVAA